MDKTNTVLPQSITAPPPACTRTCPAARERAVPATSRRGARHRGSGGRGGRPPAAVLAGWQPQGDDAPGRQLTPARAIASRSRPATRARLCRCADRGDVIRPRPSPREPHALHCLHRRLRGPGPVPSPWANRRAYQGPLFDTHLHYNQELRDGTTGPYPAHRGARALPAQLREAIIANSRPNAGTQTLAASRETRAAGVRVVPLRAPLSQPRRLRQLVP